MGFFMKITRCMAAALLVLLSLALAMASHGADLVVSAAASLTNAFADIGREFERTRAGTKVLFNFGASGQLLQQIAKGAPVDIFASADEETMDRAESEGLLEKGTRADFVRNSLVLVVPADSKLSVTLLDQLTKSELRRIAIGNPDSVPAGRHSKAALQASGVWDALQGKIVNTQNVRQSLNYVARGEVEAAFVYRTDAAILPDKVRIVLEVPTATPVLYPLAILKGRSAKSEAKEFVAFVRSDAAQRILQKYGFGKP
jgi:molybdate transport system substrate-binding protein